MREYTERALGYQRMVHMPSVQDQVRLVPALYQCATHVSEGSIGKTNDSLSEIKRLYSIVDGPLQRLSQIMADSLARRLLLPCEGLTGSLIHPSDYFEQSSIRSARYNFASLSPYLNTGFATINRAILEAMEPEKVVRIIDLSCSASHPRQWFKLLHAFHGRPGGPPVVRLTVVHDDNEFLANMKALLSKEADMLKIPFQFNDVNGRLETLDFSNLRDVLGIKYGEAIAISCSLQMHRLLVVDDNVSCSAIDQLQKMANTAQLKQMASSVYSPASILNYPRTPSPLLLASFLSAIHTLKPHIMLVMEQDANHNALLFSDRFVEALNYYAALFDSFKSAAQAHRCAGERARAERLVLGEEIRGVVAREGAERKERHERLAQWARRMEAAGMERVGLSYAGMMEARKLLQSCGWGGGDYAYQVVHDPRGEAFFCWHRKPLYSVSAWRPAAPPCRHT